MVLISKREQLIARLHAQGIATDVTSEMEMINEKVQQQLDEYRFKDSLRQHESADELAHIVLNA